MPLQPGTRLGPYEIVSLLGKGGMGEVYRAKDTRLERDVAIKVLPAELSENESYRKRLEREAKTISQLQHPNVCTLYDIGTEGQIHFLVMELLEGSTLADRLDAGPLPLEEALRIGREIAEAMEAAHRRDIVHRDLKPGNVMLTEHGTKVLDFGLAKGIEDALIDGSTQASTRTRPITREGALVGTVPYMAPEQLEGRPADARTDLWALGCVIYEMVIGERPFQGDTQASLITSIMSATPEPVSQRQPVAPERLDWVVSRCLERNSERRWQSARDVAIELEAIAEANRSKEIVADAADPVPVAEAQSPASTDTAPEGLSIYYARRSDGAMTAYGVMGSGPVLIMPPGATTHLEWYTGDSRAHEFFCSRLAGQHTLVLYDRHGCGLSDRHRKDYSAEDDLLDLDAVVEAIGETSFDFFGISWGGIPSVAYASRHADRVGRMVLYGTYAEGARGPGRKVEAQVAALAALRRSDAGLYAKARAIQYFPSGTDRETFQSLARMLLESTTPEVGERLDEVRFDNQSLLAEVHTPTLVLHRRGDQACLFEWGQYLARHLPNARFVPLDGDAHFPWVDDAESVLAPTLYFLAERE